ncbi:lysophospholipid acyltransferase family protein [Thaumasiovibrio subtropicus]
MATSPFRLPRKTPFGVAEHVTEWATGLKKLNKYYQHRPHNASLDHFLRYTLDVLGIDYQVQRGQLNAVPRQGATLIVANHPLGAVEGVILAELIRNVRKDVKVLANHYLKSVPELSELFIGVDVFEGENAVKANIRALREANKHLQNGGALLVFPAGEVSTFDKQSGKLLDKEWSRSVAKMIRKTKATTVPMFINGRNSKPFYLAGKIHPILRTLMLGRELLNKRKQRIDIAIGEAIHYSEVKGLSDETRLVHYLRLNTYLLGSTFQIGRNEHEKCTTYDVDIIEPVEKRSLAKEIAGLSPSAFLLSQGAFDVYCAPSGDIPLVMRELGRIREVNFRAVGEGTGLEADIDAFDGYYQQLFVWDRENACIVGAYRLGVVNELVENHGIQGLYSRTLFDYDERFVAQLDGAIELGRSVIAREYQRSLSALLLLWKGIATFASRHPNITKLFGPVSISNDYSALARKLIAETMTIHHYDIERAALVAPSNPLPEEKQAFWQHDMLSALPDLQLLGKVLGRMEDGKSVPVLLRQYLGLNGKLVCFNVDPAFNNALDGLIVVDLLKVPEKTLAKYMGKAETVVYLSHHCRH